MTKPTAITSKATTFLVLPASLDADSAVSLIAQMNALPTTGEIQFNAAAVNAVSLGYLQILISAFKSFPHLSVGNASAEFVDAFAQYGLDFPQAVSAPEHAVPAPELDAAEATLAPMTVPEMPAVDPALALEPAAEMELSDASPAAADDAATATEPSSAAEQPNGGSPVKTILTIDDSRTMRDMLNMALSSAGFTVVQAIDGEDGLSALGRQPVDVVITDINMPKLDGFGVIRAIRSNPSYDNTPILVLSTEAEQESKDIAKDAGATGWIVKPFDPDGLVHLVNSVCA